MARGFNPKWIIGKTIARVEMTSARVQVVQAQPRIVFTDGSSITLDIASVSANFDDYGISVTYKGGK